MVHVFRKVLTKGLSPPGLPARSLAPAGSFPLQEPKVADSLMLAPLLPRATSSASMQVYHEGWRPEIGCTDSFPLQEPKVTDFLLGRWTFADAQGFLMQHDELARQRRLLARQQQVMAREQAREAGEKVRSIAFDLGRGEEVAGARAVGHGVRTATGSGSTGAWQCF
eukprot:365381-Chlamydomonas_euryale.AAC.5